MQLYKMEREAEKIRKSICNNCIWFRDNPLRCIEGGYNRILKTDDLPEICKKWCENW